MHLSIHTRLTCNREHAGRHIQPVDHQCRIQSIECSSDKTRTAADINHGRVSIQGQRNQNCGNSRGVVVALGNHAIVIGLGPTVVEVPLLFAGRKQIGIFVIERHGETLVRTSP